MGQPLRLTQALFLVSDANRGEVAEALWTMFEELSAIWNVEDELVRFNRFYIGADPAPGLADRIHETTRISLPAQGMNELLAQARGTYASTIDQADLAQRVRTLIDREGVAVQDLLLVTDQELTPPRSWRYILWSRTPPAWVVSSAPMDPDYWGIEDPQRVGRIKERARAACMTTVGTSLGLKRCGNPQCFMFDRVDSVSRLDVMRGIGAEHKEFPTAESIGFSVAPVDDPRDKQPLAKAAELTKEGWPTL